MKTEMKSMLRLTGYIKDGQEGRGERLGLWLS